MNLEDAGRIEMSSPDLDDRDEAAVLAALRSGVLALGQQAARLEELAAGIGGVRHGVAVSSGTGGLHVLSSWSSQVRALRPLAWAHPVMPSRTSWRRAWVAE
jgi:dTDP-4-amino-4,6-dideoxygalactose transaminase